ncbi:MAG TPA: 4-hydroxythreonine-4-phosphate dehydrogenase PdxA [Pirellulales bacterium]|jgi:4-hydroxythreonine-4-phosphate dehydrogenase|nr:4-hydroxythreonine-4-phosphate dehydrogenase PdxA [Pirellulales bacterium]
MDRPRIAITLGDPTGIGPEIVVRAWSDPAVHAFCRPLVVGHPEIVRRAASLLGQSARVLTISNPAAAEPSPGDIPCIPVGNDEVLYAPPAQIDARGGQAAYDALVAATKMALDGEVDAITTGPLHKAALWQAGHHYPGHTELLAELCGVDNYAMMLYLGPGAEVRGKSGLAVVHVTLHMALRDAIAALNSEGILRKSRLVSRFMAQFTPAPPRVGVCALNPHAGEEGLFGDEERTLIRPAVELGVKEGLNLEGPLPADTLLARARNGEFDAVVAMVHDQGHIAIKLLAMHRAVNVTLGLPIVRTSVAHGTAFDVAWQGRAEAAGMVEALRIASRLAIGTLRDSRGVENAAR